MSGRDLAPDQRRLLVVAARRFYLEDRSKVEIAEELGLSRFKVARLLQQARETGVVTIALHDEGAVDAELSERVREHLGLREAEIVEASGTQAEVRRQVGYAAAELLGRTLKSGEVLGLAWGRTLSAMTESLPTLPPVSVVQLTGTLGTNVQESPVEIVRKVAVNSGGSAYPIFVPLLVEDPATAAALKRQPDVAKALGLFDDVTTAVISVGSWEPPDSQLLAALSSQERETLRQQGVRADLLATLLNDDGIVVPSEVTERGIAVSPEQLRQIPRVVAVAGGADKGQAVVAVARAGLITGLVADRALAEVALATTPVSANPSNRRRHNRP